MENTEKKQEKKFNIELIISLIIVMATILGTTIPMYIHTDTKTSEFHKDMYELRKDMADEMKDFHARLIAIEERNRK